MNDGQLDVITSEMLALSSAIQMLLELEMRRECRDTHLAPAEVTQRFAELTDREAGAMRFWASHLPADRKDAVIFAAQESLARLVVAAGNRLHRQPPDPQTP